MKQHRALMLTLVGSAFLLIVTACAALQGDVATHRTYVPEGTPMVGTGIEVLDDNGLATGDEWVIVDKGTDLPPEAPVVDPEGIDQGDKNSVVSLFSTIGGFLPTPFQPFAPFAGYLLAKLLGKRNRQNWGKAIASAAKGDIKGAVRMAAAAEGIVHTSEDPEELMAVASKKRAIASATSSVPPM